MTRPVELVCAQCGERFFRHAWVARRGAKYCGQDCAKRSRIGKPRPDLLRRRVKQCATCRGTIEIGGRTGKTDRTKFCSMECQRRARRRRGNDAAVLSQADAAYLAGIVDGEGSVMLTSRKNGGLNIALVVANTDLQLLTWILSTCAIGHIYRRTRESATHRTSYAWRCFSDSAVGLIRQLQPYLRIKRTQADLAARCHERLCVPALKADPQWQAEWIAQMKTLNRRGPRASEPTNVAPLANLKSITETIQ